MFCQDGKTSKKQTLWSFTTFKMSQQILEGVKCDHDLSLCVAGVAVLSRLIVELKKSAEQGHIWELK